MGSEGGRSGVSGEARARGLLLGNYAENTGKSAGEVGGRSGQGGPARAVYRGIGQDENYFDKKQETVVSFGNMKVFEIIMQFAPVRKRKELMQSRKQKEYK